MSAPLVFMDTETTGLSLEDDIWEFAAIRREADGTQTEHHIFIEHDRAKCASLPPSFRDDHYARYRDHGEYTKKHAAEYIAYVFRHGKPHVVGAVPNFDTERITRLIGGIYPAWQMGWHYHLIDVENLAVGYLMGRAQDWDSPDAEQIRALFAPPWSSDELAAALGVEISETDRHTAMGDARWAMRIYDAVIGGAS